MDLLMVSVYFEGTIRFARRQLRKAIRSLQPRVAEAI
jgi:hypothetical protein